MKDDIIVIEEHHREVARKIVQKSITRIMSHPTKYLMTVAGESGSGKSETARAIADELKAKGLKSIVLGQDDYFYLPPKLNDTKRRKNPDWMGPHVEVNIAALQENINQALNGTTKLVKPIIDYHNSDVGNEEIDIAGTKVIIAEGTYTSLLKNINTKIFIARNRIDTLSHRKKRNRGTEAQDPFIEEILKTEHKIIAGHMFLADFVITKEYNLEPRNNYSPDGKKISYYQVNATFFSALGEDEQKLRLSRAIQLFMPGIPQVWYLDLFAGKNNYEAADNIGAGGHKEINRTNLTLLDVENGLKQAVVKDQLQMIRLCNTSSAFNGELEIGKTKENQLQLTWKNNETVAALHADLLNYGFRIIHTDESGRESEMRFPAPAKNFSTFRLSA